MPAQFLLDLEILRKMWCWQLLKFSPFACPNLVEFRDIQLLKFSPFAQEMISITSIFRVAAQILLNLETVQKKWWLQLLKFSSGACPNRVEFGEIAKEVMTTNAYNYLNFPVCLPKSSWIERFCTRCSADNYLNFPPLPAQILLSWQKLRKK